MKALVGAFNQEKVLVGAFSVIAQLHRLIDLRTTLEAVWGGEVTLCPCVETTGQCVHPYTGRGHDTSAPGWECVVITAPVSALHSAIYRGQWPSLHLLSARQAGAGWGGCSNTHLNNFFMVSMLKIFYSE